MPGLMYTKQRLYCPALNQRDIRLALRNQIFILVRKFCPRIKQQQQQQQWKTTNIGSGPHTTRASESALHKCEMLSSHLIRQLLSLGNNCNSSLLTAYTDQPFHSTTVTESAGGHHHHQQRQQSPILSQCSHEFANFLDLIWYKDGTRLEFDPNTGRGLNKKLNLKLIDFIDQFEMTEKGTSSNDDNGTRTSSSGSTTTTRRAQLEDNVVSRKRRAPLEPNQVDTSESQSSHWPSSLYQRQQAARKRKKQQKQRRQRLRLRRLRRGQPDGEYYEATRQRRRQHRGQARRLPLPPVCPPRGLILEIDGIRRANAGRYTCALRFNITKLLTFLRTLRQPNVPSTNSSSSSSSSNPGLGSINWKRAGCLLDCCCCCKNDKSKQRCDHVEAVKAADHVHVQAHKESTKEKGDDGDDDDDKGKVEAQMEIDNAPETGHRDEKRSAVAVQYHKNVDQRGGQENGDVSHGPVQLGRVFSALNLGEQENETNATPESSDSLANNGVTDMTAADKSDHDHGGDHSHGHGQHSLEEQINTMELILNETISSSEALGHIGNSVAAGPQALTIIQTFVLIVNERPANSCQLWTTILEANEAHSRRKLADFKRLKRGLATNSRQHQQRQQLVTGTSEQQQQQWNWNGSPNDDHDHADVTRRRPLNGQQQIESPQEWRVERRRQGDKLAAPASLSWSSGASAELNDVSGVGGVGVATYAVNNMRHEEAKEQTMPSSIASAVVNYDTQSVPYFTSDHSEMQFIAKVNAANDLDDDDHEGGRNRHHLTIGTHKRLRRAALMPAPSQDAISGQLKAADSHHLVSGQPPEVGVSSTRNSVAMSNHVGGDEANAKLVGGGGRLLNKLDDNHDHHHHLRANSSTPKQRKSVPKLAIGKQWSAREMPVNYANERNLKPNSMGNAAAAEATNTNKNNSTGATKIRTAPTPDNNVIIKHQANKGDQINPQAAGMWTILSSAGDYHDRHHYSAAAYGNKTKDSEAATTSGVQSQRINTNHWRRQRAEQPLRHDVDGANQSAQRNGHSIDIKTTDSSKQSNAGPQAVLPIQELKDIAKDRTSGSSSMARTTAAAAAAVKIDDRHGLSANILANSMDHRQVMRSEYIIDGNNLAIETKTTTGTKLTSPTREFDATTAIGVDRREGNAWAEVHKRRRVRRSAHDDRVASLSDSGQINLFDSKRVRRSGPKFVTEKSNIHEDENESPDGRSEHVDGVNIAAVAYRQQRRRAETTLAHESQSSKKNDNELGLEFNLVLNYSDDQQHHDAEWRPINHQTAPPVDSLREHQSGAWQLKTGPSDQRGNLDSMVDLQDSIESVVNLKGKSSSSMSIDDDDDDDDQEDEKMTELTTKRTNGHSASNYNHLIDGQSVRVQTNGFAGNDDDSLMWAASQYLYMHMRALASSSIYGVQVDVEWSNENERTITTNNRTADELDYGQNRVVIPFATIDLVAGQNLHLQCTAQALGRLPEVRWYKCLSKKIPEYISPELANKLKRSIGRDTYWPVAELDLLNDDLHNSKNFVCSQSISIFDNLLNQTFTVVNNLKLSQFNDKIEVKASITTDKDQDKPLNSDAGLYNLYACFVDADIRHDYATLGVYFRQANSKLPIELTKRLQKARSMFDAASKHISPSPSLAANNRLPANNQLSATKSIHGDLEDRPEVDDFGQVSMSEYNMLRQNHLIFPYKHMWVPFRQNVTYLEDVDDETLALLNNNYNSFPMSPLVLSVVIAFVFGSLLGLVYLTLRSYQALTSNQQHLDNDHQDQGQAHDLDSSLRCKLLPPTNEYNNWTQISDSYCHFNLTDRSVEHTLDADVQLDDVGLTQDFQLLNLPGAILRAPTTVLLDRMTNLASTSSLYTAHVHNLDDVQCDYSENRPHSSTMNLIVDDQDEQLDTTSISTTSMAAAATAISQQQINTHKRLLSEKNMVINIMSNPLSNNEHDHLDY